MGWPVLGQQCYVQRVSRAPGSDVAGLKFPNAPNLGEGAGDMFQCEAATLPCLCSGICCSASKPRQPTTHENIACHAFVMSPVL